MSIQQKLLEIQLELKAPKNLFNAYSNFKYRSAESILENLKPLLKKHNCLLKINDEIVMIGVRYYVKSTTELLDLDTNESIVCQAYAREEETKKGMDCMQITGASSSYAKKYCLNDLFLLDDTKDVDALDNTKEEKVRDTKATESQIEIITKNKDLILDELKQLNVKSSKELKTLSMEQASILCQKIKEKNK